MVFRIWVSGKLTTSSPNAILQCTLDADYHSSQKLYRARIEVTYHEHSRDRLICYVTLSFLSIIVCRLFIYVRPSLHLGRDQVLRITKVVFGFSDVRGNVGQNALVYVELQASNKMSVWFDIFVNNLPVHCSTI